MLQYVEAELAKRGKQRCFGRFNPRRRREPSSAPAAASLWGAGGVRVRAGETEDSRTGT